MISENKRNGSGYYDPTAYMAMMNVRKEGENKMEVYRGDIFYVKSNRKDTMKETTGSPAVVVSNDKGNENSNFVEIVYLTADERNLIPTHVNVMCKVPSVALCERISNVSKDRLEEYIRSCTDDEMRRIDEALMLSLGIKVIMKLVGLLLKNFGKIKRELYQFLAGLSGMTEKEIAALPLGTFTQMIVDVFKKEEFSDFFQVVSGLLK